MDDYDKLGVRLKEEHPEIEWIYDDAPKMWIAHIPSDKFLHIINRFVYHREWSNFLGVDNVLLMYEDEWIGFTID
jgi:hypothetical protein